MLLTMKTYVYPSKRRDVGISAGTMMQDLLTVYNDIIDATLMQYGNFGMKKSAATEGIHSCT